MKMNIIWLMLYLPMISTSASNSNNVAGCQKHYKLIMNQKVDIWTYTLKNELYFQMWMWLGEDANNAGNCSHMISHELYKQAKSNGICSNHNEFKIYKNIVKKYTFPYLESNNENLNTMRNRINIHLDPGWNYLELTLMDSNILNITRTQANISASQLIRMQDYSDECFEFGVLTDRKILTCPHHSIRWLVKKGSTPFTVHLQPLRQGIAMVNQTIQFSSIGTKPVNISVQLENGTHIQEHQFMNKSYELYGITTQVKEYHHVQILGSNMNISSTPKLNVISSEEINITLTFKELMMTSNYLNEADANSPKSELMVTVVTSLSLGVISGILLVTNIITLIYCCKYRRSQRDQSPQQLPYAIKDHRRMSGGSQFDENDPMT